MAGAGRADRLPFGSLVVAAALLVSSPVASQKAATGPSHFNFVDVSASAGLTRTMLAGRASKDHLLDSAGGGVAFLDYDRDGRLDAFVVNGWRLDGAHVVEKGKCALYKGMPDGTFRDVTDQAGVGCDGRWGSGAFVADYDGDGWPDILVTTFGANLLYRNLGNGTFVNVAAAAGIESPGWNTGAAFFDADGDGDLGSLHRLVHRRVDGRRPEREADAAMERRRDGGVRPLRPQGRARSLFPQRRARSLHATRRRRPA